MANPMATESYVGINAKFETFKHDNTIVYSASEVDGSAQVGLAVTMVGRADKTVGLVGDGELVAGKLIKVESDGRCTVQTGGYCTLPAGDSATVTPGTTFFGDLGAASAEGYIQTGTTAGSARGMIIDNDTLTAVVVNLNI